MFEFLNVKLFDVRIWLWITLVCSMALPVLVFTLRHKLVLLRREFYKIFYLEKLIKIIIHYKNSLFTEHFRLLPLNNFFKLKGGLYKCDDAQIIKNKNFFAQKIKDKEKITFNINGKNYNLIDNKVIKKRIDVIPEIHYYFNNPIPIDFETESSKNKANMTAKQLRQFQENNLVSELLSLRDQANMTKILIFICVIVLGAILFLIAKQMGYL